ncbi:MAG: ATP synthase F1 subunit gamma [Ruminococcus sp.]|nr:ATP synthase F1 subunit gamma [Ruminococcus sp.]MCD7800176.1 ATP synthase F1 subunit gamma [Ruminococcus sp.]
MASSNIKDIKRRIKSVESTMQITKAMELVSSSKLRRAKERADNSREYFHAMYETICQTATESPISVYTRPILNDFSPLLIVIAGDRGLAGGFNSNILKLAESRIKELGGNARVLPIGKKAVEYFEKRSYHVVKNFVGIAEHMTIYRAEHITDMVMELFNSYKVNTIEVIFTNYVSPMLQEPRCMTLLPIPNVQTHDEVKRVKSVTEFEPSPEAVFSMLVPKYIAGMIYCTVVDSFASEQASRRSAMENATDNATQMIDTLSLEYNRARQSAITQEITEIVGGATSVE